MVRYLVVVVSALALSVLGTGALFWIQNSSRTTQLSLDLGIAAWQLSEPVSVPALIAVSFGIGLLVGGLMFAVPSQRNARKARRLEAELALSGAGAGERDGWHT